MIYELALEGEKVKKQQIVALHLIIVFCCIVTGALILLLHYASGFIADSYLYLLDSLPAKWIAYLILFLGVLLLYLLIFRNRWLLKKTVNRPIRIAECAVLLVFFLFSLQQKWFLPATLYALTAATVFFALYWETVSDPTLYVRISESGVRLPANTGKRSLHWKEIEQVIFRFGILTINCYDNRLFQWPVQSANFQKEDFRQFCDSCIAQFKDHRDRDSRHA